MDIRVIPATVLTCTVLTCSVLTTDPAAAQTAPPSPAPAEAPPTQVVVTAKAPAVVHKIDRSVYDLTNNLQAQTGSVSDVLTTLPAVTVDPAGNISVRGASVQVMVDGKPSAALRGANLAAALQSMPANTVARIEVITNPGPEFRSDAATIINIITRKARGAAPAGSLTVNAGPQARYNASAAGSFGIGTWRFNAMAMLRQDRRFDLFDSERVTFDSDGAIAAATREHRPTRVPYGVVSVNGDATYNATDNDAVTVAANIDLRRRPRRYRDGLMLMDATGAIVGDSITVNSARQYYNDLSLTGTYTHKGRRDGESLTVRASHEEDDSLRDSRNATTFILPLAALSHDRQSRTEREVTDDLSADYVLPFAQDTQFKTGFDIEIDRDQAYNLASTFDDTTQDEIVDTDLTRHFSIDHTLAAGYIDYQHPLGRWRLEGGLRVEHMLTRLYETRQSAVITTSDLQWSPSLHISRDLSTRSTVIFSYSHRIDRPSSGQLNPLPNAVIAQTLAVGNPYLQPGQTGSFEAGYVYTTKPVTLSATLYARQLNHQVTQYSFYPHPGDTILVSTYENAGRGASQGLDLSLDLQPSARWGFSLSSNIMHITQSAPAGGAIVTQSLLTQQSKVSVTYAPNTNDSLQVQAQVFGNALAAQGTSSGYDVLALAWRHKFTPRLRLIVTVNDLLDSVRFKSLTATAQFLERTKMTVPGRIVYIGLDYKLGALRAGS